MDLLILELPAGQVAHEKSSADKAAILWPRSDSHRKTPDQFLELNEPARLDLAPPGTKHFSFVVPGPKRYGLYTQHLPSEFALELTKNDGTVQPISTQEFAAGHTHDDDVRSVGIHLEGALDQARVSAWLRNLLREQGADIFRMKGIVHLKGNENRYVFQGVHMLIDGSDDRPWGSSPRASDVVFIGRNLDRAQLTLGLRQCLA
jgi:hypothetical protein